jgi:hypothetical protein
MALAFGLAHRLYAAATRPCRASDILATRYAITDVEELLTPLLASG